VRDKSIDEKALTSEEEFKRMIIGRVLESNAWEVHRMRHKDAQVSTVAQEGGFSRIEKSAGKKHEDEPAITYDSNTKNFVIGCNCGKEKFVFDTRTDKVESESTNIRMKEMDPYKRKDNNENNNFYGRTQRNYGKVSEQNQAYGSRPQNGYDRSRDY